jgi:hypothetical protein
MRTPECVPYGSAYGLENLVAQNALRDAAAGAVDEALVAFGDFLADDRTAFANEGRHRVPSPDVSMVVSGRLPAMYEDRYSSFGFLKSWVITLSTVGWKLAQAKTLPLTNVAEELAMHVLIEDALALLEIRSTGTPEAIAQLNDLYEGAFEDNDFFELYRVDFVEELSELDPHGHLGFTELRFESWFQPFGSGVSRGVPHPFLELSH